MPITPNPVDEAIKKGVDDLRLQDGPTMIAPFIPSPTTLLDLLRLTTLRKALELAEQTAVIPPIGGLDPNQSQGPPAGTAP